MAKRLSLSDNFSSTYSITLLLSFAVFISLLHLVERPVICWVPQHFTESHEKYTNYYCWVRSTYYLPSEEELPKPHEDRARQRLTYYPWIPFILLGQAALFYLPSLLWQTFNTRSDICVAGILESVSSLSTTPEENDRKNTLTVIRNHFDQLLDVNGRRCGTYLTTLYIFTKLLCLVNVIGQLLVLNFVLSINFSFLEWMYSDRPRSSETSTHEVFPRVTMCDLTLRRLGNLHQYSVQCTLPLNMYNRIFYTFLWFWLIFVGICTTISLATWTFRAALSNQITYITSHLKIQPNSPENTVLRPTISRLEDFTKNYLRQDGVLVLHLANDSTNSQTISEVLSSLWQHWLAKHPKSRSHTEL